MRSSSHFAVLALVVGTSSVAIAQEVPAVLNDQAKPGATKRKDAATPWWKDDDAAAPNVDAFGAFGFSIPIEVPAFRGITPRLALAYDSAGGNGWAGVGWSLDGIGRIERASAGKGAPAYDASDIFLLNGEELVPCVAGSVSPSCTTGGTHSTKNESFTRIAYTGAGAASRWTITAKDGTRSVYAPVHMLAAGVFRWGLDQVIDTRANTVTYAWIANPVACCWDALDTITYNGTTIKLHYEARATGDKESRAIGGGALVTVQGRLKTIDISVGGSRLRAYRLTYAASTATSRSLLGSVRQYGRDAVLDASGTITGGSALPAITTGYQSGSPSFVAGATDYGMSNSASSKYFALDINGDGKTDMLELYPNFLATGRRAWISNGAAFTEASNSGAGIGTSAESRFYPADVNGDGKDDFIELYPNTWNWGRRTWISNGTGWTLGTQDTGAGAYNKNTRFFAMDVNRDGKTDLLELYPSWSTYRRATWLSTGTGWTLASDHTGISYSENRRFETGDVNGDGRGDLIEISPGWFGAGTRKLWLSNGTGFTAGASDSISFGDSARYLMADVNGDGKTDMVELASPFLGTHSRKTWLSTGYGFTLASTDSVAANDDARRLTIDVNGDGRDDIVELHPAFLVFSRRIWLSTGGGFVQGAGDSSIGNSSGSQIVPADLDGDGLTEMVDITPSFLVARRTIWRIGGAFPDLLTSVTNEWGGTTAIGYTASSAWTGTNGPPVVQSTTSLAIGDGRGGASTTTFSYAGALYDASEQKFLGFRYQKETRPCIGGESACPYQETWFRQDLAAVTMPERIDQRDGNGTLQRSALFEYATSGATVPRTALPTGRWEHQYVGSGAACPGVECKRTYEARTFNAYGEVTAEIAYGDYEVAGDEDTTTTVYVPNTAAYIVDRPADVKSFQGVGSGGTLLNETLSYYDGAASWNVAPSAGLETRHARWLSAPSSFVATQREYDAWGNVTADVNALGARTTYAYDATFHLFETSRTNALLQPSSSAWDVVCGQPTQAIDLNGQTTTTTYDTFCRVVQRSEPGGNFERHTWVSLGSATAQHELVERPAADGTASPQWTRTYLDGRRRAWRTVARGPDAATGDIVVDTSYDARGHEAAKTAPYYWVAGAAQPATYTTTRTYDARDRLTRVTASDGTYQTTTYGLWSATTTDELGRSMTDRHDARGQRVAHDETVGGVVRTTTYVWDARGYLRQSTDPLGNVVVYAIDSLGRRTAMVDPDWGAWSYEYDGGGRLVAQTDAKGQRTTLGYDALDRTTQKTTLAGTASAATVTWTYDQARAGFYNRGTLTGATDAAGGKTLDHDVAGRVVKLVRTTGGTSYTFLHGFDAAGRALWTTYPDGDTQGSAAAPILYDGAGRVRAIPGYVTSVRYNAEGKLARVDGANGTVSTRAYNPHRGWLTGIVTTSGATTIQNLTYTRNAKGMVTQTSSPFDGEGWVYGYDDLDRLTTATSASSLAHDERVTYDAIGNITWSSRVGTYAYAEAGPHAVSAAGASTYAYDAAGLMTAGASRTLTWNGDNALASVTQGGTTMTFTYDGDGARIQQVEGAITRRYVGDDFEVHVLGTTSKYVSVAGTLIARSDGATRTWIHTDQQGSIQAETSATGVELHRKKYRPYGALLASSGALPYESRGYTGQRQDLSGLLYLHARYYDPALGRFISPDPIVDGPDLVGLNRYAYAGNDPINHTDITGFCKGGNKKGPSSALRCKRVALEIAKRTAASLGIAATIYGAGTSATPVEIPGPGHSGTSVTQIHAAPPAAQPSTLDEALKGLAQIGEDGADLTADIMEKRGNGIPEPVKKPPTAIHGPPAPTGAGGVIRGGLRFLGKTLLGPAGWALETAGDSNPDTHQCGSNVCNGKQYEKYLQEQQNRVVPLPRTPQTYRVVQPDGRVQNYPPRP
ncbi:MAG TPA: RHS repeat-associated core domain-containing protein [Kofleriaceae bacterium]|nr:RHS repeat-associated core domain-containing protein [Kofleriaceae bacterium]